MKYLISTILALFLFVTIGIADSFAYVRVKGYTKRNGNYVKPYYRSNTNRSKIDNWSTKGNVNPYTGKRGYKNIWK